MIESAINVYEGLYDACVESFARIDPQIDLPEPVRSRFQEVMLKIGCEFNAYDSRKVRSALSTLDLQMANFVVDELRFLSTVLSRHDIGKSSVH